MQTALENFKKAEDEGAERLAPDTYSWAKTKIYDAKKVILHSPDDLDKIEEATDEASAAAAQLLAAVRKKESKPDKPDSLPPEQAEKEAIKVLVNEGGPAI